MPTEGVPLLFPVQVGGPEGVRADEVPLWLLRTSSELVLELPARTIGVEVENAPSGQQPGDADNADTDISH